MRKIAKYSLWLLIILLAACNMGNPTEEALPTATVTITPQPTRTLLPTLTPLPPINNAAPTAIVLATAVAPPTSAVIVNEPNTGIPLTRYLQNGRGLSTGQVMSNGEFQVEGYCTQLNSAYGVAENDIDWFCTYQGQRALTLQETHFTDICRRTYNNQNAFALRIPSSQPANEQWRCLEYTITPTPTVVRVPMLLQNGIGMSTGSTQNNGNFEVEGYCTAINSSYGVSRDDNYWYCTSNGQRIITLGTAEFDDICFRTYRIIGAFAIQESNPTPAFGWRCYAYFDN